MNKFVEKYKKAKEEFNNKECIYKGNCMICDAITDVKKRLDELEKYKSEYFTVINKFDEVMSSVNEEIKRCGYLIRIDYKDKETILKMIHVGSIYSDERVFSIDDSVNAVINDNGLIKYERNTRRLWNVCFALDGGFDICEKETFDKWIEIIKKEFNKNIG